MDFVSITAAVGTDPSSRGTTGVEMERKWRSASMRMFAALLACCLGGVPAGTGSQQWCNLSCPCPLITRCPLVCGLYVHACVCVCVFVCVCVCFTCVRMCSNEGLRRSAAAVVVMLVVCGDVSAAVNPRIHRSIPTRPLCAAALHYLFCE